MFSTNQSQKLYLICFQLNLVFNIAHVNVCESKKETHLKTNVCGCVCVLVFLHIMYQNAYSTSQFRTF